MDTVKDIYDEVLLLRRRAVAFGPVAEVFTEDKLNETFGPDGKEAA
jgi:ABC-type Mn2+/Zn2+ transport system ATPase subunit